MEPNKDRETDLQDISRVLNNVFSKLVSHKCSMCGAFLNDEEHKQFEGVCKKHWDY